MSTKSITITFSVDQSGLQSYEDRFLAALWHVAQANPAPIENHEAADIAERIGREIIRRWLATAPVELWAHQGSHPWWWQVHQAHQAMAEASVPTEDSEAL